MDKQIVVREPLLNWPRIGNWVAALLKETLVLVVLYSRTTWGLLKNPWAVIMSTLYMPTQSPEMTTPSWRSQLLAWWKSPLVHKKQALIEWFRPAPEKAFQTSLVFFTSTWLFFGFMTAKVDSVRDLFPHKIEPIEATRAFEQLMVQDSSLRWADHKLTPEEKGIIVAEELRLEAQKNIRDNAIRLPAIFVILLVVCFVVYMPIAKHYDLNDREVFWVGLYGLSLALLVSIPAQLLTDVPASSFTLLGNILFLVGWLVLPIWYFLRYVTTAWPGVITKKWRTGILLVGYQSLVFLTIALTWQTIGVRMAEKSEEFHKSQQAKRHHRAALLFQAGLRE